MKALKIKHPFWQVLGMGLVTGMRSTAAPVITSHILSHHRTKKLDKSPLRFLQKETVETALKLLALSELVMDKLPSAPNRIGMQGVIGRGLAGALAGASIFKATGGKAMAGALLGGSAAVASTFGSFYLRRGLVKKTRVFDPFIGAVEDALVIGAGVGLAHMAD